MPGDEELLDMHVRALFTHDARGRLLSVNEPWGQSPAPPMYFGRTRAPNLWRFRSDLPAPLVEELDALCADEPAGVGLGGAPRHAGERRLASGRAEAAPRTVRRRLSGHVSADSPRPFSEPPRPAGVEHMARARVPAWPVAPRARGPCIPTRARSIYVYLLEKAEDMSACPGRGYDVQYGRHELSRR